MRGYVQPPLKANRNILSEIVDPGICIGCGICAAVCPAKTLHVSPNAIGAYEPRGGEACLAACDSCLRVCPQSDCVAARDALARELFPLTTGICAEPTIGHFRSAVLGHVADEARRLHGASGGIASWLLAELIRNNIVDAVISVGPAQECRMLFAYRISENPDDVLGCSKTAYYPVEMSAVLERILREPRRRYAVIGVPCFINGLRLAGLVNRRLKNRIVFHAGLTCGHQKTKGYADYVVSMLGLDPRSVRSVCFRGKDPAKSADEHMVFIASSEQETRKIYWCDGVSAIWRTGQFGMPGCRYCDDLFGELADVSFMDAWMPECTKDGRGTSIVVTRSEIAESIIRRGIDSGGLTCRDVPVRTAVESQWGQVLAKTCGLSRRLWRANKRGMNLRRRVSPSRPSLMEALESCIDERINRASHEVARTSIGHGPEIWMRNYASIMSRALLMRRVYFAFRRRAARFLGRFVPKYGS